MSVAKVRGSESVEDAFRQHYGEIYRFLLRRTRNHHDAEELTQRVFADASEALQQGREVPGSLLGWLYAVASRRFIDSVRQRTARASIAERLPRRQAADTGPYGPAVAKALREAINHLSPQQREIVVLRLLRGVSFAEIAERIEISEDACKMRFSRGLAAMREILEEEGLKP